MSLHPTKSHQPGPISCFVLFFSSASEQDDTSRKSEGGGKEEAAGATGGNSPDIPAGVQAREP